VKQLVLLVVKQLMEFVWQDKMFVVDFDLENKVADLLLVRHDEQYKYQENCLH